MEERRRIDRVKYVANSVMVICDTQEKLQVQVENVAPMGMAIRMTSERPDFVGKDVIVVTETLIMYATVRRVEAQEDGSFIVGVEARKFTDDVLQYLFEHIG
ncbi:MAG: hypothetical protein ACI4HQ_14880 [Acetatifactor sp.]